MNILKPKLSITIPTFNRAKYLYILLESLNSQYSKFIMDIEIIVCDNNSTDNTSEVIRDLIAKGMPIKYIINDENMGLDRNIAKCFFEASSEYVWIIGDDDILSNNALEVLMPYLLGTEEYGIVYSPSIGFTSEYPSMPTRIYPDKARIITDKLSFAKMVGGDFAFISGCIVNKKIFLERDSVQSIISNYDTFLVHLSWLYLLLIHSESFLYLNARLVLCRQDNSGGYKIFEVFCKNQTQILNRYLAEHPRIITAIKKSILLYFVPTYYINNRLDNAKTYVEESDVISIINKNFAQYVLFWIIIYPLYHVPNFMLKPSLFLIKCFGKLNRIFNYILF